MALSVAVSGLARHGYRCAPDEQVHALITCDQRDSRLITHQVQFTTAAGGVVTVLYSGTLSGDLSESPANQTTAFNRTMQALATMSLTVFAGAPALRGALVAWMQAHHARLNTAALAGTVAEYTIGCTDGEPVSIGHYKSWTFACTLQIAA